MARCTASTACFRVSASGRRSITDVTVSPGNPTPTLCWIDVTTNSPPVDNRIRCRHCMSCGVIGSVICFVIFMRSAPLVAVPPPRRRQASFSSC
ncbi:hypothetical protein ACFPRL_30245 [Pseudoclavibacter helvolus]